MRSSELIFENSVESCNSLSLNPWKFALGDSAISSDVRLEILTDIKLLLAAVQLSAIMCTSACTRSAFLDPTH